MLVTSETTSFLIFILDGVFIGLLFDFFRILRKSFKTPDVITYLEDIVFGILSGTLLIFSIIAFNNGELRLFIFLGIILGLVIYMLTISKYIIKVSVKVLNIIIRIVGTILKVLFFPLIFMFKKFKHTFIKLQKETKKMKNKEGIVVEK